jgi:hypothetical protein
MCGGIDGGNNLNLGISILQSITFIQFFKCFVSICGMTTTMRWRGSSSRGRPG